MIITTFNSQSVLLANYRPDWSSPVMADFVKNARRDVGLTNRENRQPLAAELVTTLKWSCLLNATEAAALRAGQAAWVNQPILVPFWPAETLAANYAASSVQGQIRVWYEPDWSNWSVNTGTSPGTFTPSQRCLTAPVMFARLEDYPLATIASGNDDEFAVFKVVENGAAAYALAPKAVTLINGTAVNGIATPLMNVPFAWGKNTSQMDVRIKRENVGFGRIAAETFYAQTPRTRSLLRFTAVNTAEIAYLLKLFADRGGSIKPFWCPPPYSLLAANLVYGRFFSDKLSISWLKPNLGGDGEVGELSFEFLTLPTESTVPGGETFGATIGPVSGPWFGYVVTCGSETWRFTSYESDVVGPGGFTFSSQKLNHGEITEEINLAVNDCTLTVHAWTGCPFSQLVQQLSADAMMVTIYEGTIDSPTTAQPIYTGQAMAPKSIGPKMSIKLRGPGATLSILGPRCVLQETCLAVLGDSRCKVTIATYSTTQQLLSITAGVGEFNVLASGWVTSYFKGGYAERTVGTHIQRIPIADSYATGSGKLGILFGATVTPAPTGAESGWQLFAGCDGYFSTCRDKFSNKVNFRGAPYLPKTNPSILPVQTSTAGQGKKS